MIAGLGHNHFFPSFSSWVTRAISAALLFGCSGVSAQFAQTQLLESGSSFAFTVRNTARFSPAGDYFCFFEDNFVQDPNEGLVNRDLRCASMVSPGPAASVHNLSGVAAYGEFRFSESGDFIYFTRVVDNITNIYRSQLGDPASTVQITAATTIRSELGEWLVAESTGHLVYADCLLRTVNGCGLGIVDLDSPGQVLRLSTGTMLPENLALTPDHQTVVYRTPQLAAADLDGGEQRELSFAGANWIPSFDIASNGQRVVYRAIADPGDPVARVYIVPTAGGASMEVPWPVQNLEDNVIAFAVSPDGSQVAFIVQRQSDSGPLGRELFVASVLGVAPTVLLDNDVGDSLQYPVGDATLAYQAGGGIKVVDTELAASPVLLPQSAKLNQLIWAPTLNKLVYNDKFTLKQTRSITGVNSDGSNAVAYFLGPKLSDPSFVGYSPAADRVYYLFDQDTSGSDHYKLESVGSDGSVLQSHSPDLGEAASAGIELGWSPPQLNANQTALVLVERIPEGSSFTNVLYRENLTGSQARQTLAAGDSVSFLISPSDPDTLIYITEDASVFLVQFREEVFADGFETIPQ